MNDPVQSSTSSEDVASATIDARVEQAYLHLLSQGKRPTWELVRQQLGGGSFNTIGPAFRKAKKKVEKPDPDAVLPDDEAAFLLDFGKRLYLQLHRKALDNKNDAFAATAKERDQLQAELDGVYDNLEQSTHALRQQAEQFASLTAANEAVAAAKLQQAQSEAHQLRETVASLQSQLSKAGSDLQAAGERINALGTELRDSQARLRDTQGLLSNRDTELATVRGQLDVATTSRDSLQTQLDAEVLAHKGTAKNNDLRNAQFVEFTAKSKLDDAKIAQLNEQLAVSIAEAQQQHAQLSSLAEQGKENTALLRLAHETIASMQKTSTALPGQLDKILSAISLLRPDQPPKKS